MTERAARIFEQSLTLVPEARAAFVDEKCQGDARLQEEVTILLNEAKAADKFFDRLDEAVFPQPP